MGVAAIGIEMYAVDLGTYLDRINRIFRISV